jgi:transcription antitermination factor NusG
MTDRTYSRGPAWYALRIRSNQEKVVTSILESKGYESFLPLYRSTRRWSDRVKQLDLPVFPGYLFCRLDLNDTWMPVLTTPGVIAIAGVGKQPVPVSDEEIDAVHMVIRSGLAAMPWSSLAVGGKVLVERGPLAGVEGIAINVDDRCKLVVSINLLQRALAVEIDRSWVRPITESAADSHTSQHALKGMLLSPDRRGTLAIQY